MLSFLNGFILSVALFALGYLIPKVNDNGTGRNVRIGNVLGTIAAILIIIFAVLTVFFA